jgi:hypothetical protein
MYNLSKKEKMAVIMDLFEKTGITAYESAQNTTLSEVGIQKILKKEVKSPHESTLNELLLFFEKRQKDSRIDEVFATIAPKTKAISDESKSELYEKIIRLMEANNLLLAQNLRFKLLMDRNKVKY